LRLLFLLALGVSGAAAQEPVRDWIAKHAIPLKTVEPGRGTSDLQAFREIIGDARIVALGEATHGTREFFQLKHRLVELLVAEMGFSIFAIENTIPEAERLNEYIVHGRGDPEALLKGLYGCWNTREVLAMVQWMRAFNASGKGQIEFTGFDEQTPGKPVNVLQRDATMARNVKTILDRKPGAKVIVWAHNGHVQAGADPQHKQMGRYLREWYGADLVVFGFAFHEGRFRALQQGAGVREFQVGPAPPGTADAMLASVGLPLFALDLRLDTGIGAVSKWFREPHRTRSIGAIFFESNPATYLADLILPDSYDVVLFIAKTTASIPAGLK
jgi:erythromycin esterase-like protein